MSDSIWASLTEEVFGERVSELARHYGKTVDELVIHPHKDIASQRCNIEATNNRLIPFELEYQLVQDLAFIASDDEGAKAVAAVSLNVPMRVPPDHQATSTMSCDEFGINVAVNSGVNNDVRSAFHQIAFVLARRSKGEQTAPACIEELHRIIVTMDKAKILSRLRCELWNAPRYMKERPAPLFTLFNKAITELIATSRHRTVESRNLLNLILRKTKDLETMILKLEREGPDHMEETLISILKAAGNITDSSVSLVKQLETIRILLKNDQLKVIRAFDKLANYSHICHRLARLSGKPYYKTLISSMKFTFLEPYPARVTNRQSKHVHAEVQLAIFHRLQRHQNTAERSGLDIERPIVIGTSKAACYLCNLFLSLHTHRIVTSATHGVLYEQWTIPDLDCYTAQDRSELRLIVEGMLNTFDQKLRITARPSIPYPPQSDLYHSAYEASASSLTTQASAPAPEKRPSRLGPKEVGPPKSINEFLEPKQTTMQDTSAHSPHRWETNDVIKLPCRGMTVETGSKSKTSPLRSASNSPSLRHKDPAEDDFGRASEAKQSSKRSISTCRKSIRTTVKAEELYHTDNPMDKKPLRKKPTTTKHQRRVKTEVDVPRRSKHTAKKSKHRRGYNTQRTRPKRYKHYRRRATPFHTQLPLPFKIRCRRIVRRLLFALCGLGMR